MLLANLSAVLCLLGQGGTYEPWLDALVKCVFSGCYHQLPAVGAWSHFFFSQAAFPVGHVGIASKVTWLVCEPHRF